MGWFKSRSTAPASARPNKPSRLLLQALEPRLMFDGAAVQTAIAALHADAPHLAPERAEAPAAERWQEHAVAPAAPAPEKQVVFVDTSMANYQGLLAQLPRGAEVVLLDPGKDGLAQIAQWAGSHRGYAAMHILSHGQDADLLLGNTALTTAALEARQGELAAIGGALQPGGDILLYGCKIGAGTQGAAFVARLSELSHADVAASVDATGAARLGGNWTLERHSGRIEAAALQLDYDGLLTRPSTGTTDFTPLNGSATAVLPNDTSSLTVGNWLGWDFTMRLNSKGSGGNQLLQVSQEGGSTVATVNALSDGSKQIEYLSAKANDGSLFTLNSISVVLSGYDSAYAGGAIELVGYRNGTAVNDATLTLSVEELTNGGRDKLFNVSGNNKFQGIDAFRVQAVNGHFIVGAVGIGNINATDFYFPGPALVASAGNSTYSAGNGLPVAVDSGITLSSTASYNQASATVSITNFNGAQDLLAFNNNSSLNFGNIAGSFNSATGVLTLTSSGASASNAQWQAALAAVTYQATPLNPNTATRSIIFTITDAGNNTSTAVLRSVTVAPNAAPVIGNLHGDSVTYTAGGGAVRLDSGAAIVVSDADTATFNGGYIASVVTGNARPGEDVLGIDTSGAVSLSNGTSVGSTVSVAGVAVGTIASNGDGINGHRLRVDLNSNATQARVTALAAALTYNDSAASPNSATRTVQVVVDDGRGQASSAASISVAVINAPILGMSGGSAAFVSGDNSASTPVPVDGGLTVTDPGSSTLASAKVAITGNFRSGEDILSFSNDGASMGNISASYNPGTGELTLTSAGATATLAQWQAALRAVTYTDSRVTPDTATRTLSFQATDGNGNASAVVTRTLTVTATDQTPIASTSGGSASFTGADGVAGTPVVIDGGLTLSDLDNSTLASAKVAITGNFRSGEDVLSFSNDGSSMGNIVASYNGATGELTLTSSGATATLAQWQSALRAVRYGDSAAMPNTATRTVSFSVSDGSKTSAAASRQVTVATVAQTPLVSTSGGSTAFASGDNGPATPVAVDSGLTLNDLDSTTLASAQVRITGNFQAAEDVLAFANDGSSMGNIVASYNGATGVLTLTSSGATATLAQWQAALRAVSYTDSAATPNTATRTVSFTVSDGGKTSASVSKTVALSLSSQSPIATTSGGSAAFTGADSAAGAPVAVDDGLTLSDRDSTTLASAKVSITGNFQAGEDVLAFSNTSAALYGNIVASYNAGSGVLSLSSAGATATLAQWQAALRAVSYGDSRPMPHLAPRTVSFSVNDGSKDSAPATRQVTLTAAAQTPVLVASGGSTAFASGDNAAATPVAVDGGLTLSDLDSATLASAQVRIAGNFQAGEDVLAFNNNNAALYGNIAASYNTGTGVLSLSSNGATATLAQWQAALRAVTYTDSAVTPNTATRTVSFSVDDGGKTSASVSKAVSVSATPQSPVLTSGGGSTVFNGGDNAVGTPVSVDGGLTLSDLDSSTLASAKVAITGNFKAGQDVLAFANDGASMGNIVGSYNAGTGELTLTSAGATATLAQWQAALRAVHYGNSALTPDTASRSISFRVNDGGKDSASAVRAVSVTVPAQAPVLAGSAGSVPFTAGDGVAATPVAVDAGLNISDRDSSTLASAKVAITGGFQAGEDVLAFVNTNAASYGNIAASYDAATGVLSLSSSGATASVAQWQAALRAVTYTDSADTPKLAPRTVEITVSDGAKGSNAVTRGIALALPDYTPVLGASGGQASFVIGGAAAPVVVDGGLQLSDRDSATLASASVRISGNFHAGEDVLAFTNTNATLYGNIAASYNGATGVLSLTSSGATATVAQWQAALRAVTYADSAAAPAMATRTVAFSVNDGGRESQAVTRAVQLSVPTPQIDGLAAGSDTGASASDGITANASPTLSGKALAGAQVAIRVDGVEVGTTTADGSGNWRYTFASVLSDGTRQLTVLTRSGGVDSQPSTAFKLVIDTQAPAGPADVKLSSGTAAKPALSGKAEAGSTVTILIDGAAAGKAQADGSGAWAWQGGTALADGQHRFSAVATDLAGNVGAATAEQKFTVDTRVPLPPAPPPPALGLAPGSDTGSSASDGLTSQNRPTIQGTAQAGSTVTVYVDGAAAGAVRADADGAWRYTLGGSLADGAHSITAVAENAGGKSAASAALALQIDTAAPGAPAVAGLGENPAQPRISGSAEANSIVTVYIDNAAAGIVQADASGRWTYQPSSPLAEGQHTVRAVAVDAAGNTGASSAARNWSVDGKPPAAPTGLALAAGSDTGASASDGLTGARQPLIQGTAAPGSRVSVSIDGVLAGSTVADAQGAWSLRPGTALADGQHRVTAVAANAAGAASAASAPLLVTIDTAAPRVLAITALDATNTSAESLRYEVQFSKAVALRADALDLVLGGSVQARIVSIASSGEGRYLVQLSASGAGSVALALRQGGASDLAGNVLGQGASGPAYQVQAAPPPLPQPSLPQPPSPAAETRPAAGSQPATDGAAASGAGGTAPAGTPVAPTIVLDTVAATAEPLLPGHSALAGGTPALAIPAWGADRFATSAVAGVFGVGAVPGTVPGGLRDMGTRALAEGGSVEIRLPADTPGARGLAPAAPPRVQLSDGRALPGWLRYDAQTGRIVGKVPPGWRQELTVEVRSVDEAGHEHVTRLKLSPGAAEVKAKAEGGKAAPAKAAPAKAALNEQLRQYGKDAFEQQLAAWLSSDEAA